jgi:hypothetical protein
MEPSQMYSLEEQLDVMGTAGMDEPIETMIENHPYLVFVVERRAREDLALLGYDFFDKFKLIRSPQRLHEPFEQLLFISKLNGIDSFFIEYTGNINNGKPIFVAYGSGFSTHV